MPKVSTAPDWRKETTITVQQAAEVLGISLNSAYQAVRAGELPSIGLGHRKLIPVAALRTMLGEA